MATDIGIPSPDERLTEKDGRVNASWYRIFARMVAALNAATRELATSAPEGVAVAALPSAANAGFGARGFVTDANATTFASIVAGGGANAVPVYSDATNWRIG